MTLPSLSRIDLTASYLTMLGSVPAGVSESPLAGTPHAITSDTTMSRTIGINLALNISCPLTVGFGSAEDQGILQQQTAPNR